MLTVAGDGPQREQLRQLARDLSLRNVRFVGRVPPEHMPALYDEHDVWLKGSDVDNMPMPKPWPRPHWRSLEAHRSLGT